MCEKGLPQNQIGWRIFLNFELLERYNQYCSIQADSTQGNFAKVVELIIEFLSNTQVFFYIFLISRNYHLRLGKLLLH